MVEKWRDPVFWSDVVQLVKTVLAGVVAWVICGEVLGLSQSFLAPWSALLVVHATVYRTFAQGVRQVAAAVIGVVLAWAVGNTIGVDTLAVAVVLAIGMVVGMAPWFRGETSTAAATALIVLTTGFAEHDVVLLERLADTGIGIAVGLIVNVAVWPPLRRRSTIAAMDALDDRLGEFLVRVSDGLREGHGSDDLDDWMEEARDIERDLDHAWSLLRQAVESARLNPRRSASELRDPRQWRAILELEEQALADLRSMVRTISQRPDLQSTWHPGFRDWYVDLLRRSGEAIAATDHDRICACRDRLDDLLDRMDKEELPPLWPVYGGLVVNLRNVLDAMARVAAEGPIAQPPLPFRRRSSVP